MPKLIKLLTEGLDNPDPLSIIEYENAGGFSALKKTVSSSPEEIIAEIKKAKLLGRGGAAYPAGSKWEHLLHIQENPKYIVCNADEGEPGTFKDRLIMDKLPYKLLEGILIAAAVFGAKTGYIYVRGEYRKQQKKLIAAIENIRAAGYMALLPDKNFDIHVISGAGAYVCGENSALLNSTEGKVGRPRIKPPHLAEVGLFLHPTLVNNVETFANIPLIVNIGGDAYLEAGHPDSGGSKLICLSGHCKNRGVFEVPLGKLTLRDIIYDPEIGGGISSGIRLKFFHLGGQSGSIGCYNQLDTIYSYTDLKKAGLSVGSGAIVVMDEKVSIVEYVKEVTKFFIDESCGKCIPCREGNRQVLKILEDLSELAANDRENLKTFAPKKKVILHRLFITMSDASFCGLGQTASAALNSAAKHFSLEFEGVIDESSRGFK